MKKNLSQFVSEMFDSLLEDSTKYVLQNMSLTVCYHGNILGSRPPQY